MSIMMNNKNKNNLALRVSDLQQARRGGDHDDEFNNKNSQLNHEATNINDNSKTYAIDGHVRPSDVKRLVHKWVDSTEAGFRANSMLEYLQYQRTLMKNQQNSSQTPSPQREDAALAKWNLSNISAIIEDHEADQQNDSSLPLILSGAGKNFNVFEDPVSMKTGEQMLLLHQQNPDVGDFESHSLKNSHTRNDKKPPQAPTAVKSSSFKVDQSVEKNEPRRTRSLSSLLTSQQRIVKEQEEVEEMLMMRRKKLMGL